MSSFSVNRCTKSLVGELRVPSDKSLTHRAYMFGAAAAGKSSVTNPLLGEDCENTLRCLRQMGLEVVPEADGSRTLIPSESWTQPNQPLDCGNSGTTMRLMSGLIASRPLEVTLIGDESLSRRPMKRIATPLKMMGAEIEGDTAPLRIKGGQLKGIAYESAVASAQIKSAVLLAGLRAEGETWVWEPETSRDHTERMLRATGVEVKEGGKGVGLAGGQTIQPFSFDVPADISSAAFFLVAAALLPGSGLNLLQVGINPTRTGILDVLAQCGVPVEVNRQPDQLGEPVANLVVRGTEDLKPFKIGGILVPRLIDEIPILAVLATQCNGVSQIRDAKELRVKESDRIEIVAAALRQMGAEVETYEDGMDISGPTPLKGVSVHTHGDHRIGMSFAIAGLIAEGTTQIEGAETIRTSFPTFMRDFMDLTQ